MQRRGRVLVLCAGLFLGGCDWISEASFNYKIERGLEAAIEKGVSPFRWSDVLPSGITEICYFGPYDNGDDLRLPTHHDTNWALVAFDGEKEVARLLGVDREFKLNPHNGDRGCFAPDARITIVNSADRALRFEDRKEYRPRK